MVRKGGTRTPMASRPSGTQVACGYAGRTFSARGPFGPCPTVNVTASPSRSESNGVLVHAELWKKYSVPSGVAMKPKPLSVSRLMVPLDDMVFLAKVAAGAVSRVPEVLYARTPPSRGQIVGAEGGTRTPTVLL